MNKFIKLTEMNSDGGEKAIIINTAHIQYLQVGKRENNVRIVMVEEKKYFFVKESIDQVWSMFECQKL